MANLAEIATQLEKPFALEDIDFLPKGQFEKDGKAMVMGLPYADPRVYQDRLNAVCPGEWTSQAVVTVAGNKIIALVTVTICGVAHTDIGEASLDGPTKENAGTESFAQGFKRACSQVGLGRYLYALDKAYLPYDKQRKKVALTPAELRNEVRKLYAKAGIASGPMPVEKPAQEATPAARPAQTAPVSKKPAQPANEQAPIPTVSKLREIAAKRVGPDAFKAITGVLQPIYKNVNLQIDDAWEEKHCQHAYELLKKQINEKKQTMAKAS